MTGSAIDSVPDSTGDTASVDGVLRALGVEPESEAGAHARERVGAVVLEVDSLEEIRSLSPRSAEARARLQRVAELALELGEALDSAGVFGMLELRRPPRAHEESLRSLERVCRTAGAPEADHVADIAARALEAARDLGGTDELVYSRRFHEPERWLAIRAYQLVADLAPHMLCDGVSADALRVAERLQSLSSVQRATDSDLKESLERIHEFRQSR